MIEVEKLIPSRPLEVSSISGRTCCQGSRKGGPGDYWLSFDSNYLYAHAINANLEAKINVHVQNMHAALLSSLG
ncbi:hypothetical protein PM082_016854 [Marasmius tenuissimus]|nr:hypothetical protein PM082_016854 [Marasmius tenuissimus]